MSISYPLSERTQIGNINSEKTILFPSRKLFVGGFGWEFRSSSLMTLAMAILLFKKNSLNHIFGFLQKKANNDGSHHGEMHETVDVEKPVQYANKLP